VSTINPYQSPTESDERIGAASHSPDRIKTIGEMVVLWEKLRVAYNAVLVLIVIAFISFSSGISLLDSAFFAPLVFLTIAANLCFCAGPTVAAYLAWAGATPSLVRGVSYLLFTVGLTVACAVAVSVLLSF